MLEFLTTQQAAEIITRDHAPPGTAVAQWQVRRIFELGLLPEPQKVFNKRAITRDMLPGIVAAIRARGWLPKIVAESEEHCHG